MPFCIDVPKCPVCGSEHTGYYIPYDENNKHIYTEGYMHHGELVSITMLSGNNCFCQDCGAEWYSNLAPKYLNKKELNALKERKGITASSIDDLQEQTVNRAQMQHQAHKQYFRIGGNTFKKKHKHNIIVSGLLSCTLDPIQDILSLFKPQNGEKKVEEVSEDTDVITNDELMDIVNNSPLGQTKQYNEGDNEQ